MSTVLDWKHAAGDIPESGIRVQRQATGPELKALSDALPVMTCDSLAIEYELKLQLAGYVKLKGHFIAEVIQACVVTLQPVSSRLEEAIDEEFWPPHLLPAEDAPADAEFEVLSSKVRERIENGLIDAGRIVYEHLSAALDPYPRAPGAAFDWQDPRAAGQAGAGNPFAALEKLQQKKP